MQTVTRLSDQSFMERAILTSILCRVVMRTPTLYMCACVKCILKQKLSSIASKYSYIMSTFFAQYLTRTKSFAQMSTLSLEQLISDITKFFILSGNVKKVVVFVINIKFQHLHHWKFLKTKEFFCFLPLFILYLAKVL